MVTNQDIRRGVVRRFLPACLGALGTAFMFTGLPPFGIPQLLVFSGEVLGLTAGYALALRLGKRFIRSPKVLLGKRVVLTGALSIPATAVALAFFEGAFVTLPGVVLGATGIATLTGAYLGVTMFLRRPIRPPSLSDAETAALPSADSLEEWFEQQEREADRVYRDRPQSAA